MFEDFIAVAIRTVVGGPKTMASAASSSQAQRSCSERLTADDSDDEVFSCLRLPLTPLDGVRP